MISRASVCTNPDSLSARKSSVETPCTLKSMNYPRRERAETKRQNVGQVLGADALDLEIDELARRQLAHSACAIPVMKSGDTPCTFNSMISSTERSP